MCYSKGRSCFHREEKYRLEIKSNAVKQSNSNLHNNQIQIYTIILQREKILIL